MLGRCGLAALLMLVWGCETSSDREPGGVDPGADGAGDAATSSDGCQPKIRANATPRHVPARIVEVDDIPRTKSGKITELAVRKVIHGEPVKNVEALANPDALKQFEARPELQS